MFDDPFKNVFGGHRGSSILTLEDTGPLVYNAYLPKQGYLNKSKKYWSDVDEDVFICPVFGEKLLLDINALRDIGELDSWENDDDIKLLEVFGPRKQLWAKHVPISGIKDHLILQDGDGHHLMAVQEDDSITLEIEDMNGDKHPFQFSVAGLELLPAPRGARQYNHRLKHVPQLLKTGTPLYGLDSDELGIALTDDFFAHLKASGHTRHTIASFRKEKKAGTTVIAGRNLYISTLGDVHWVKTSDGKEMFGVEANAHCTIIESRGEFSTQARFLNLPLLDWVSEPGGKLLR